MNAEGAGFIHYGLISLVILTGIYGLFSQNHLLKKLTAWGVFQTGIILLFISASEKTEAPRPLLTAGPSSGAVHFLNPLPLALAFGVPAVSIMVAVILVLYAWSLSRETGKWDEDSIHRKLSP